MFFFFILCKRQRRTTGAERQTDRQTDRLKQRHDYGRTADGPAVISAPGQISINNVRQGFQYKPSPLAAASIPIFPATGRTSKLAARVYIYIFIYIKLRYIPTVIYVYNIWRATVENRVYLYTYIIYLRMSIIHRQSLRRQMH